MSVRQWMHDFQTMTLPAALSDFSDPPVPVAPGVFHVRFRNRTLAAKVVDLEESNEAEMEDQVKAIGLSGSLKHENLLSFVTAFAHKSSLWLLSSFCDLRSASDLCKPYGLGEGIICFIVRETLKALVYLHENGIIHRAVCGSHILITSQGRCFLSGLNHATSVIKNGLWRTSLHDFPHRSKKSLIFLAPEILEQNLLGYNQKSDVYSLGVTCCELSNGIAPYWNLEPCEMLLDKLTGNHAKPIDESCAQYIKVPEDLTAEDRGRYDAYRSRRFSNHFQAFSNLCLTPDPHKRPTAKQLLRHGFFKQLKKTSAKELFSSLLDKRWDADSHNNSVHPVRRQKANYEEVEWDF